jgi:glycosyltransferase involved in cell wall biosynthesis
MTLLGDGPEYKHLLDLKESFNLPIQMPGFVQPHEVTKFIDESTMVLVPSSYESFCLAAVEAAFRGRPVVASRVMALKEVIEEGKTGLLVDPQDPRQLADAIETLLLNPDRMEQMGKEALQRANNLFHIDITVNKYLSMYEQATHLCYHPGS